MIDWGALLASDAPPPIPAPTAAHQSEVGQSPDAEIASREAGGDNRRRCTECGNRAQHGLCLAARQGEIKASRQYMPMRDILRRCEGFAPLPSDPDQRLSVERWPGLVVDPQQAAVDPQQIEAGQAAE